MIPSLLPTYNRTPLNFVAGEGCWLVEADGRRFLDLGAGIAVNALGHAHPELVKVLTEQASRVWHLSNLYTIAAQQDLADQLVSCTFADTAFFTNSGTEACELAIKMARKFWSAQNTPDRYEIIAFDGAFHGRSTGAIAAAGGSKLTDGFGPLMPGFTQLPWHDLARLEAEISDRTAAVIVEPIQGEGGIRTLPDAELAQIRHICSQHGALLILDEIQCGMGRTGRLFAHEWAGVEPDIMMIAKGIGGGFPLGAVLARQPAAAAMTTGTHGSTYGGNPLACAVGCKVLETINDAVFLAGVRQRAGRLRQHLEGIVASFPGVFDEVRGSGLMLGLKCIAPQADVISSGHDAGVLLVPAAENTVRILPPLIISDGEIDIAAERIGQAAQTVGQPRAA